MVWLVVGGEHTAVLVPARVTGWESCAAVGLNHGGRLAAVAGGWPLHMRLFSSAAPPMLHAQAPWVWLP